MVQLLKGTLSTEQNLLRGVRHWWGTLPSTGAILRRELGGASEHSTLLSACKANQKNFLGGPLRACQESSRHLEHGKTRFSVSFLPEEE